MSNDQALNNVFLRIKAISFEQIAKYKQFIFALSIVAIILVLLFPVPTFLLDFLLAISIMTSILILMTSLLINKPLDLSIFPTLLLITAILRLSLNIASTRLILSKGHLGPAAAGHVIKAFGNFVMEGNLVIGVIVYAILTIINFIVITKGSGRIAEVAARFSLDAMPGKQMAIDADLSSGLIDEATAKERRKELEDESTFFGSMDGANKFVRGDAIAGLLITIVNLIAGILIGTIERKLNFSQAIQTYSILTVGDGLVSQIPSLIISLAAGLMVTKSGAVGATDKIVFKQFAKYPQALGLSSILMIMMSLVPGIPFLPFMFIGALTGGMSYMIINNFKFTKFFDKKTSMGSLTGSEEYAEPEIVNREDNANKDEDDLLTHIMQINILKIELSYNLLPIVTSAKNFQLTEQIQASRKQMVRELGFIIPPVHIGDNLNLKDDHYVIKVKDIEFAKGEAKLDQFLVISPDAKEIELDGEKTLEPSFGLPAMWIKEIEKEKALNLGYTVVDSSTVITTHLIEVIRENISELLSYSETQKLLDELGQKHSRLIADTVPDQISVSGVQRVLQSLLAEGISIRDLPTIMEAINESSRINKATKAITEFVRSRLSRQISHHYAGSKGYIGIITLTEEWEHLFTDSLNKSGDEKSFSIAPSKLQSFIEKLQEVYNDQLEEGEIPVLMVSAGLRPYLKELISRIRSPSKNSRNEIHIISVNEIHPKAEIKKLGEI